MGVPMTEPFPWLHDYTSDQLPAVPASPDPLVRYAWDASVDASQLQQYTARPVHVHAEPASSFEGLETLTSGGDVRVVVRGQGWLRLDFGTERPAWLELFSMNLADQAPLLWAAVSEYNEPYDGKSEPVTAYDNGSYRLETQHPSHDRQLYEGVRYAWLCFATSCPWSGGDASPPPPNKTIPVREWTMTGLRLVSKVQPIPYSGSFHSSDPTLTSIWWTGAYGVRNNMQVLSTAEP